MGFVLVAGGLLMIVTGAKGTYSQFGSQVASDFTGPGNFTYWIVSLGAVGSLGYIEALRAFSRMFMALILIAMVLSNKGFFAKFSDALKSGPIAPDAIGSSGVNAAGVSNSVASSTLQGQQSNLAGEPSPGNTFNGWMNYFAHSLGISTGGTGK